MEMATAWEKQSPMPHREANRKNAEKQVTEKEPLPPTPPPIHEGIERVSEEGSTTKIEPPVELTPLPPEPSTEKPSVVQPLVFQRTHDDLATTDEQDAVSSGSYKLSSCPLEMLFKMFLIT
jgi:hypothetical protein